MSTLIRCAFITLLISKIFISVGENLPEIDSYKIIDNAIKLHDNKKYPEAIAEFKKVNKNDTNYVLAMVELANSYIANKQDSLAVLACDKVLFIPSPYTPSVLLYKANALDNMKRSDEAEKLYIEGAAKYPLNVSFNYNLGILKFNQKKYKEANDLFIKVISSNPYDAGSHYQMGNIAFIQGKVVPAMLAWAFYLSIDNSSDRAKMVVAKLEKLAQNEYQFNDAIQIDGLTDLDDFSELEALVKSKVATSPKYKSRIDLNYTLTKQLQLIFEKISFNKDDKGFFMEFYAPLFYEMNKENYFEPFTYNMLSDLGVEKVNSWMKKNTSEFHKFSDWFTEYVGVHYTIFESSVNGKMTSVRHWYNGGKILAAGNLNSQKQETGYWNYYYSNGILKSEGGFDNQNKRTGIWKFYYPSGLIKSLETYKTGVVEGLVESYYENGSIKMNKNFKNDKYEGKQTTYYPTGLKKVAADYIADKENGHEASYYENGKLLYDVKVANDQYTGDLTQFYDNGHIKQKVTLTNGKMNGKYEDYFNFPENKVQTTATYVTGNPVGESRSYFQNGKPEVVGKYNKDGKKEDTWLNYYDNDTLFSVENYSNGKFNGLCSYYNYKGKLISEYTYKNDILQEYKVYDEKGKIIFQNKKDGKRNYDLLLYYQNGNKQKEGKIVNGEFDGLWVYYDLNGFVTDKINFVNGVKQGKSLSYYQNGKIKSETNYLDGETDGYYKEYYTDGSLKREGPYVKDKFVGEWKYFTNNGNLQNLFYYKDNVKDGWQQYYAIDGKPNVEEYIELGYIKKRIAYDTSGRIYQESEFDKGTGPLDLHYFNGKKYYQAALQNDMLEGPASFYFSSGQVSKSRNYVDDNLDGEAKTYFANGKMQWLNNFVYGNKHGKQTQYDEDGNIIEETEYYYGQKEGKSVSYYPNKQIEQVSIFKNDELEGERSLYDESGELVIKRFYHGGYMTGYTYNDKNGNLLPVIPLKNETGTIKAFYKNGSPSIEYTLKYGYLEGKRTVYFPNGKIYTDETYASGDKYGSSKAYYPSGKIKEEEQWKNDYPDGKCVYYYENGKVKSEKNFMEGEFHGITKNFDTNGKLTKTYVYYNGDMIDEK